VPGVAEEEIGPSIGDPESFRKWVFKEMKLSADLWREEQNRDIGQANIHRGMLRGIRHVAQQLGVPGLDLQVLRNFEFELLGFAPEPDELLRPPPGETLRSRIAQSTYEERWLSPEGDEVKVFVGPESETDELFLAWADYRGVRWLASASKNQEEAIERLVERLTRNDPAYGDDWGPPF
jgi:hypothetical protein